MEDIIKYKKIEPSGNTWYSKMLHTNTFTFLVFPIMGIALPLIIGGNAFYTRVSLDQGFTKEEIEKEVIEREGLFPLSNRIVFNNPVSKLGRDIVYLLEKK